MRRALVRASPLPAGPERLYREPSPPGQERSGRVGPR